MGIYGNYLLLEKNKDEPNRTPNGVVFNQNEKDKEFRSKIDKWKEKQSNGEKDKNGNYKLNTKDKKFAKMADSITTTTATTSFGKDIVDSKLQTRIETFDKEKAEYVLKSEDIVKEYNLLVDAEVDKIINSPIDRNYLDGNIVTYLQVFVEKMQQPDFGFTKDELRNYLKGKFFYTSDNPNNIKALLNLRIHYCEWITGALEKMVKNNQELLHLNSQEVDDILNNFENDDTHSARYLRQQVYYNSKKFIKDEGILDLTPLGAGKIYYSVEPKSLNNADNPLFSRPGGISTNATTSDDKDITIDRTIDQLFQKSFKYKAIILCHGLATKGPKNGADDMLNSPIAQPLIKLCKEYGMSEKEIVDYYSDPNKYYWVMQAINAEGITVRNVDYAIAAIYMNSGKKENTFLLAQCNPEHVKVNPIFNKIKNFRITYSDYSNFSEYGNLSYDDIETAINESEWDLMNIAESCGIDYDNLDTSNIELDEAMLLESMDSFIIEEINPYLDDFDYMMEQVIQEGKITETIKNFAKKALEMVIKFFKKLWEIVKKVFQKIKEFFTGAKDTAKEKLAEPLKIKIIATESAFVKEYQISSKDELEKIALDNIKKLESEISKRQKEQTDATKKLDEFVEKQDTSSSDDNSNKD